MSYVPQEPDYEDHLMREPKPGGYPVFSYEKLEVYKRARLLKARFTGIAKLLPKEERYNLTSQLLRSSLSMVLNIVEGSLRFSGKDQARFTEIAYGSMHEAFICVVDAEEHKYILEGTADEFRDEVDQLSRMLSAYRNYQLNKPKR